jgi:hypothetical protein
VNAEVEKTTRLAVTVPFERVPTTKAYSPAATAVAPPAARSLVVGLVTTLRLLATPADLPAFGVQVRVNPLEAGFAI